MSSDSSALESEERSTNFVAACTMLAGPNVSGKSSIYRTIDPSGEFVNADVIALKPNLALSVDFNEINQRDRGLSSGLFFMAVH